MLIPIRLIIVLSAIFAAFTGGYFYGWSGEYEEVIALEKHLNEINSQSQKLLRETQQRLDAQTLQQQATIKNLEEKYHETIGTNDDLYRQLTAAQLQHRERHQARSGCALPKADNSARSQKDDDRRRSTVDSFGLSERFDSFVSGKAKQADKIDADRRLLLDWVKSIPDDLVDK